VSSEDSISRAASVEALVSEALTVAKVASALRKALFLVEVLALVEVVTPGAAVTPGPVVTPGLAVAPKVVVYLSLVKVLGPSLEEVSLREVGEALILALVELQNLVKIRAFVGPVHAFCELLSRVCEKIRNSVLVLRDTCSNQS
jgi:hypothetical protein